MKTWAFLSELAVAVALAPLLRLARALRWRPARVSIVGWWGSETVGDVAILGRLIDEIAATGADVDIVVVSFDAALTRRTMLDAGLPRVEVRPVGLRSAVALVACRALVFGGGPLMESASMLPWAWRARIARLAGARVVLYANGIGPVRTARATAAIRALLRAATHTCVRDEASAEWVRAHLPSARPVLSFDPAYDFVRGLATTGAVRGASIALALRAPPPSYLGIADATAATERFLDALAPALDRLADAHDVTFTGIVMHAGGPDSDDHAVLAALSRKMRNADRLRVAPGVHRVSDVVEALRASRCAVTVRFHAMIFSLATDTPFVAIDYARPEGKVSASAALAGRADAVIAWDAVSSQLLYERVVGAMMEPSLPRPDLRWATEARQALLRDAIR